MFSALLAIFGRIAAFIGIFIALGIGLIVPVKWLSNHIRVFGTPYSAYPLARYTVQEASFAVFGLLALVFVNRILEERTLSQSGFAPVHIGRDLVIGFVLGLLISGVMIASMWTIGQYHVLGRSPHFYPMLVLGLSFCVGIFEETAFRGLLFNVVERRIGTGWALGISSALFGLIHIINPDGNPLDYKLMRALATAIGGGLAFGGAYLWTRRLWMPIALHAGWDFLLFVLNSDKVIPNSYTAAYITRPSFSWANYFILAVAPAAVGFFLLRAAIRRGEWKPAKKTLIPNSKRLA